MRGFREVARASSRRVNEVVWRGGDELILEEDGCVGITVLVLQHEENSELISSLAHSMSPQSLLN